MEDLTELWVKNLQLHKMAARELKVPGLEPGYRNRRRRGRGQRRFGHNQNILGWFEVSEHQATSSNMAGEFNIHHFLCSLRGFPRDITTLCLFLSCICSAVVVTLLWCWRSLYCLGCISLTRFRFVSCWCPAWLCVCPVRRPGGCFNLCCKMGYCF